MPERLQLKSPANSDEPALPVPKGHENAVGEPLVGEATKSGPIIVVTAIELKRTAREALAQRLGPGHIVLDIRHAGPDADIVLIPAASTQLLGILRRQFPRARILATEFTDDSYNADFRGPISRILASDIDGYFMAPTMDDLARVTQSVGRAVAGALTSGREAACGVPSTSWRPTGASCWRAAPGPIRARPTDRRRAGSRSISTHGPAHSGATRGSWQTSPGR